MKPRLTRPRRSHRAPAERPRGAPGSGAAPRCPRHNRPARSRPPPPQPRPTGASRPQRAKIIGGAYVVCQQTKNITPAHLAARAAGGMVWALGTTSARALESAAGPDGRVRPGPGETRLFIRPGYAFRAVDRLVTNFHLPRSTLLMLVAALAGYELTMRAYREAVREGYRFYSYGDAMAVV